MRYTQTTRPSGRVERRARGDPAGARRAAPSNLRGRSDPVRMDPLALGELSAATRLASADLLAFYFTRVAGDETRFAQRQPQSFVVGHQRAGYAVANRAGLTRDSAALDVGVDIELPVELYGAEGLLDDHAAGFPAEEFGEGAAVDRHFARALTQVDPRARSLAPAGAVEGIGGCFGCHCILSSRTLRFPAPWAAVLDGDARCRRTRAAFCTCVGPAGPSAACPSPRTRSRVPGAPSAIYRAKCSSSCRHSRCAGGSACP